MSTCSCRESCSESGVEAPLVRRGDNGSRVLLVLLFTDAWSCTSYRSFTPPRGGDRVRGGGLPPLRTHSSTTVIESSSSSLLSLAAAAVAAAATVVASKKTGSVMAVARRTTFLACLLWNTTLFEDTVWLVQYPQINNVVCPSRDERQPTGLVGGGCDGEPNEDFEEKIR